MVTDVSRRAYHGARRPRRMGVARLARLRSTLAESRGPAGLRRSSGRATEPDAGSRNHVRDRDCRLVSGTECHSRNRVWRQCCRTWRPAKPEFLWHTTLGDLFVECKQAALFESALRARVDRFTEVVRTAIGGAESVPEDLRLDVFVRLPARNGIDLRIARAVKDALDRAALGEAASYEEVTATLRARAVDLDRPYGTVRSFLPAPNTSLIHATSAYSSLVVEAEPYYERVAATLIRRARDQLPRDGIGAVFVRTLHTMRAIARANALLAQTAYERTPWISLVSSGISVPMWRPDQPFDNRLLEERPPLSVHSAQHRRPRV